MSESELAQYFVDYLDGFDLYFEAPPHHVDIVAISGKKRIAIEVKKQFNFKVIEQAYRNLSWFHLSYVATVPPKRAGFQEKICRDYGIGVLYFHERWLNFSTGAVDEAVTPKFNKISKMMLDYCQYDDYMKKSVPGSSGNEGKVVTAFKMTVWELEKYVKHHPGCSLKDAINGIDHHYSSFTGARSCIAKYIKDGVIDSIYMDQRKLYIKQFNQ
jgi:hypothetical protein